MVRCKCNMTQCMLMEYDVSTKVVDFLTECIESSVQFGQVLDSGWRRGISGDAL